MPATELDSPAENPLVAAILRGNAPRPLRLTAARGVLPISRIELLRVVVSLAADPEPEIRDAAKATLSGFSEPKIARQMGEAAVAPGLLRHFASDTASSPAITEAILGNAATTDDILLVMIPSLTASLIDLLLVNQTRLIRSPDLITRMESAVSLTPLQRTRLEEMRRHFLTVIRPATAPAPPAVSPAPVAALAPSAPVETTIAPESDLPASGNAPDGEEGVINSAIMRIMHMNTAERVQLAFRGTREERSVLIKDSSKMVQQAVLDSPKISESEIESIAKMRSVPEEILRTIAASRDWMKSYTIVHSLTTNPKTPPPIAMNLLSRLTSRDLKLLAGDKNVSEVIRRQARKVIDSRNAGMARH